MNPILLQKIRDSALGVSAQEPGNLNTAIYLQQIRDAWNGVVGLNAGSLAEDIYLAEIVPIARGGDTTGPTVSISGPSSPSATLPISLIITFSKSVSDFVVGDLTLGGPCTAANFAGSGTTYTVDITPSSPNGPVTVNIAANVAHDAAGNGNSAATQYACTSSAYTIADEFTTDRAAGAINGTNAEPTGGARTVTDTNSIMTISGGALVYNGSPAGNDGIGWFATAISRSAGKTLIFSTIAGTTFGNGNEVLGFLRSNALSATFAEAWRPAVNNINNISGNNGSVGVNVLGNPSTHPTYYAIVLRATGAKWLRRVSTGNWVMEWADDTDNTATLYAAMRFATNSLTMQNGFLRVVANAVSIIPLVSDSFNRSNGSLGTANGAGSEETAPTGTWVEQSGTWVIASNLAGAAALLSGKAIATLEASNNNVIIKADLTLSLGVVGVVVCYVDSNNYIIAYHDGTNAKLDKVVAGVTTNVISAAATYSAGKSIVVRKNGTSFELYYNNARVGSGGTISDAGVISGTKHGLYTTDITNTMDNFVCWAIGTGEYDSALNKYINP